MLKNDTLSNKIIFANWKMHFSKDDLVDLCQKLQLKLEQNPAIENKLVIAPPNIYLHLVQSIIPSIQTASQDVSRLEFDQGAFTGEISAYMLQSLGVKYAIVGHYERRKIFGESSAAIVIKAKNCLKKGIIPILCFGEEKIGVSPLQKLQDIDGLFAETDRLIYAYEPYWAIGNENFQFSMVEENIHEMLEYLSQNNRKNTKSLIYGGSVNSQNILQLNTIKNLDGLLVGSASLKLDELLKILENI
jgi:triosephosphate isomerase